MPDFISDKGKWYPAKEKIGLINKSKVDIHYNGMVIKPGEPFVYDGPDREALKILNQEGLEYLGTDFRHNPDFIQSVRNMGFDNVKQYLKHIGYDEKADDEKFKEKAAKVEAHEIPERVAEIKAMGGGRDMAGSGKDVIGGFGPERLRDPSEVKK